MPQLAIAAALQLVGPFGLLGGTALNAIGIPVSTGIIGGLLGLGPKGKKQEATERSIKSPTPVRVKGYGPRRLYGASMLFDSSTKGWAVDVWAFADGRANAVLGVYLNDEIVTLSGGYVQKLDDDSYGNDNIQVGYNLGLPTETAFAPVIAAVPEVWTSAHRGDGIVSGYMIKKAVKSKNFIEVYPQGDNISLSLALELQWVFDPRDVGQDPEDPTTWAYSTNAALHLLHYYLHDRGEDYAAKFEPVIDYWIDAADDCDVAMTLAAGGTEPRYRGCVIYEKTALPGDVVAELLACFDGWTSLDENGCRIVYSGRLYEPTVSIGAAEIVGFSHQAWVEAEDAVNQFVVQYVSSEHKYSVVEAQAWRDEADIIERGSEIGDSLSAQVPSHTQARRLAKRQMLRRNAPDRGTVITTFAGRSVIGHRYINLTIEEAGAVFYDGLAEITGIERNYETGGVSFEWVAVDPDVDDWDPETEDGFGAAVGDKVPLAPLMTPIIVSLTVSNEDDSGDEAAGARIAIEATGPDRDDLTWFARWRVKDTEVWATEEYPDTDPGTDVDLLTSFVPVNNLIEVQIQYLTGDGRLSPWSTPSSEIDTTTQQMLEESGDAMLEEDGELMIEG